VNWEAITAVSEFIGVVAVVISLVYLAQEVRANTGALKASAGFDSTQGMATLNEGLVQSILGDAEYQRGASRASCTSSRKCMTPRARSRR
jgi:hypothetical protein